VINTNTHHLLIALKRGYSLFHSHGNFRAYLSTADLNGVEKQNLPIIGITPAATLPDDIGTNSWVTTTTQSGRVYKHICELIATPSVGVVHVQFEAIARTDTPATGWTAGANPLQTMLSNNDAFNAGKMTASGAVYIAADGKDYPVVQVERSLSIIPCYIKNGVWTEIAIQDATTGFSLTDTVERLI